MSVRTVNTVKLNQSKQTIFGIYKNMYSSVGVQSVKTSPTHHMQKLIFGMKYLSTKIHNNVTILKFLQKSQHCLLQKTNYLSLPS